LVGDKSRLHSLTRQNGKQLCQAAYRDNRTDNSKCYDGSRRRLVALSPYPSRNTNREPSYGST